MDTQGYEFCLITPVMTDPARPLARHAPGADVVVSNDAVLDTDRAEAHMTHSLLAGPVRDNRGVNL